MDRPRYSEGQILRAGDLTAEQNHRIGGWHRHRLGPHGWGIVAGLRLHVEGTRILVSAGMAVDDAGRELVIGEPVELPATEFGRTGSDALDVWAGYRLDEERARTRDAVRIEATAPGAAPGGRVCLGRVHSVRQRPPFTVQTTARRYASLVAEHVRAPAGPGPRPSGRLTLGSLPPGDPRRFAVSLGDAAGVRTDRWTIDAAGSSSLAGHLTARGRLRLDGLRLTVGAAPAAARPWRLHRTRPGPGEELRWEIGARGDPARNRLAVAAAGAEGAIVPLLTVTADRKVVVRGDLRAARLVRVEPPPDPGDPRSAALAAGVWTQGLAAPGPLADRLVSAAVEVTVDVPAPPDPARPTVQVTVRNTGTEPLRYLALFENLMIGSRVARSGWIAAGLTLSPGESRTVPGADRPLQPPGRPGEVLSAGMLAVGLLPDRRLAAETTKKDVPF